MLPLKAEPMLLMTLALLGCPTTVVTRATTTIRPAMFAILSMVITILRGRPAAGVS